MPKQKRHAAKGYKGVYYIDGTGVDGRPERVYYIRFKRNNRTIEEKAGWQRRDDMTPAKAAALRVLKATGKQSTNEENREAKAALSDRMTIQKLADYYFDHVPRRKAINNEKSRYNLYVKEAFGDKVPEEVDPLSFDRLKATLSKRKSERTGRPLSPTTVRHALMTLRGIVNFGVQRGLTAGFKTKVPVPPPPANMVTEDLTPAQVKMLVKALDADEDQDAADIVRLALYTGARRAEIMRLRWNDVDLSRGVWMLRDRKDGRDGGFPLSANAKEVLARRLRQRLPSPYVFPGRGQDGVLRDPRAAFERIRTAANLPEGFRLLHGLRHHLASMLVSEGVDLFTVSKLLGHSTPELTAKRYAHLRPGALATAAETAGRLITAAANAKESESDSTGTEVG